MPSSIKADAETQRQMRVSQPNFFLPFDRTGIDPFTQRFPITLRLEGTVRGTGGLRIVDDSCATTVPGLYAAGDAATRELICGGFTGGGSHNAAWAMSSGYLGRPGCGGVCAPIGRHSRAAGVPPRHRWSAFRQWAAVAGRCARTERSGRGVPLRAELLPRGRATGRLSAPPGWLVVRGVACGGIGRPGAAARARSRRHACDGALDVSQRARASGKPGHASPRRLSRAG